MSLPSTEGSCIWSPLAITRIPPNGNVDSFNSWRTMSMADHCSALMRLISSTNRTSKAKSSIFLSFLKSNFVSACSAILRGDPLEEGGKQNSLWICSPPKCIDLLDAKLVTRQNKPFESAKPKAIVSTYVLPVPGGPKINWCFLNFWSTNKHSTICSFNHSKICDCSCSDSADWNALSRSSPGQSEGVSWVTDSKTSDEGKLGSFVWVNDLLMFTWDWRSLFLALSSSASVKVSIVVIGKPSL